MIKEAALFQNKTYDTAKMNPYSSVNLENLYAQANAELGLQQSKRDQIITLYLAMFSFLLPFALSMEIIGWQVKGFILLAAAVIGILFSLIILRYRIYKEVYWFCCQSITVMMGLKPDALDKATVQAVFYQVMLKKGRKYVVQKPEKRWNAFRFMKDNLFSAETIYYLIHVVITVALFGLSAGLISGFAMLWAVILGCVLALVLFAWLMGMYFKKLGSIYDVLVDDTDVSFNNTFKMAWFLHLF